MSLFSTKKKVYVSSTVYKLNEDSPNKSFMKEVIASTAISNSANTSFAEAIQDSLRFGPRASQRSFFRWAKDNFDLAMPRAAIDYNEVIDYDALKAQILTDVFADDSDILIDVYEAFIDNADESYYAEQWVYENRPELALLDWAADVDPVTNEILIQYPPGTMYLGSPITTDEFTVTGFNSSHAVIVTYYRAQTISTGIYTPAQVYIYKLGDGVTDLDAYRIELTDGSAAREFYPFIPLRINNKSVFHATSPAKPHEALITKAWKKALGTDIATAISEIDGNPDVNEIDYAYLVFGVSLNTESAVEREYLFEFFRGIASSQGPSSDAYGVFEATNDALGYHPRFNNGNVALNTRATQTLGNLGYLSGVDIGTESVAPLLTNIHLTIPSPDFGVLDMRISWSDIWEEQITGQLFFGAKTGDIQIGRTQTFRQTTQLDFLNGPGIFLSDVSGITIGKQISSQEYILVHCVGLQHKNLIYKGKSVDITAEEAMSDPDASGFVIPLHEPTLKRMGSVKATGVARESYVMVFNSYQVVKKKWYQSGFFGFILAIVVIVVVTIITVITAGAGTPAAAATGSGILGSAAAVGAALGFSGLLAIAVGAAANAIAAMIVLQIVNVAGSAVFGDKIGRILTAVVAVMITLGTGANGFSFENLSQGLGWSNMAAIDKLALMTNSASDLIGSIQQEKLADILGKTKNVLEDYKEEMNKLQDLMKDLIGDGILNPRMLTDFTDPLQEWNQMGEKWKMGAFFGETPDDFLNRTLLTATDLIEISEKTISNFVEAALTLP